MATEHTELGVQYNGGFEKGSFEKGGRIQLRAAREGPSRLFVPDTFFRADNFLLDELNELLRNVCFQAVKFRECRGLR